MKQYEFMVHISGYGNTPEEAWGDAVLSFYQDPGSPHDEPFVITDDDADLEC